MPSFCGRTASTMVRDRSRSPRARPVSPGVLCRPLRAAAAGAGRGVARDAGAPGHARRDGRFTPPTARSRSAATRHHATIYPAARLSLVGQTSLQPDRSRSVRSFAEARSRRRGVGHTCGTPGHPHRRPSPRHRCTSRALRQASRPWLRETGSPPARTRDPERWRGRHGWVGDQYEVTEPHRSGCRTGGC